MAGQKRPYHHVKRPIDSLTAPTTLQCLFALDLAGGSLDALFSISHWATNEPCWFVGLLRNDAAFHEESYSIHVYLQTRHNATLIGVYYKGA